MTPDDAADRNPFREGRLTLGLVLPLRDRGGPDVDFPAQLAITEEAERLGFSAVWVRDVPLNGGWYPEEFGHLDPFAMLGAIAVRTRRIMLGTAATVLTLRHPLHIAKAALSVDILSEGRFILGLGSGDRQEEFAAFGQSFDRRRELYRDHWTRVAAALDMPSCVIPDEGAPPETLFELRPPPQRSPTMLAIGSGGQTLEWIARNASGWATYHRPPAAQQDRYAFWRRAVARSTPGAFRSFSIAMRVDLAGNRTAPGEEIDLGYRGGIDGLRAVLEDMRDKGVHHVLFNLVPNGRPMAEQLGEISHHLLPALG